MKSGKGSFTLEMAVWMSLFLLTMTVAICSGVELWEETIGLIGQLEEKEQFDLIETMYRVEMLDDVITQWME